MKRINDYGFSYVMYKTYMYQKLYQKWEIIYNNYNSKAYDEYYDETKIILNVINKML